MINKEFRRRLTTKISDNLIARLETLNSQQDVFADLDRLRRLVDDGQINKIKLQEGLKAASANAHIPEVKRVEIMAELNQMDDIQKVDLKSAELASHRSADEVKEQDVSSDLNQRYKTKRFKSEQLLLPASISIEGEHANVWNKVDGEVLVNFLNQIGPIDGVLRVVEGSTECHWLELPWYTGVALVRVTDPSWSNADIVVYYLNFNGNLYRLNGTSPPIHEINAKADIRLNEQNVLDYIRFFCFFVRGDEGPFYVLESMDDPFLPTNLRENPEQEKLFKEHVRPVKCEPDDEKAGFLINATIFYANALFSAKFSVETTGMVNMLSDDPIAGDLSVKLHAPLAH